MKIQKQCKMCRKLYTLEVSNVGYEMMLAGAHIQDAFPELSLDDRELLISGICGKCFDDIFAEDEEDGPDWDDLDGENEYEDDDSDEEFDD